jgi:hypothetical protein
VDVFNRQKSVFLNKGIDSFLYLVFSCREKIYKRIIKRFLLHNVVYDSQMWLNLPRDDHQQSPLWLQTKFPQKKKNPLSKTQYHSSVLLLE